MADVLGRLTVEIVGDNSKLDKSIKSSEKDTERFAKKTQSLGKSLGKLFSGIGFAVVAKRIFDVSKEAARLAATADEVESKFNVVFGESAEIINEWATTYSESVGRSETDTLKFLGVIGDTLKPLGFTKDAVDDVSKQVVELAGDLASFNNLPTEEVIQGIQSALVGNVETLRRYGVVANEAAIQQEAINSGISETGKNLTAQEKAQAILNITLAGTTDAQGDLLRTQDSAANTSVRLESATKDLKIAFGNALKEGLTPLKSGLAEYIDGLATAISAQQEFDALLAAGEATDEVIDNLDDIINFIDSVLTETSQTSLRVADAISRNFGTTQIKALELIETYGELDQRGQQALERLRLEEERLNKAIESTNERKEAQKEADDAAASRAKTAAEAEELLLNLQFESLSSIEKQIVKVDELISEWEKFESIPQAQELLNFLTEERTRLVEENTEATKENVSAQDELILSIIEAEDAMGNYRRAIFGVGTALEEVQEETLEAEEFLRQFGETATTTVLSSIESLGTALVEEGLNFKTFGKFAIQALAEVISALGAQLAAQAALAFFGLPPRPASGAGLASGAAAAFLTAGVLRGVAGSFQEGGIVGGTSFTGDNVPAMVNSGEMILNGRQQAQLFALANGGGSTTNNNNQSINVNALFSLGNEAKIRQAAQTLFPALQGEAQRRGASII
jgi:hypothetical protein